MKMRNILDAINEALDMDSLKTPNPYDAMAQKYAEDISMYMWNKAAEFVQAAKAQGLTPNDRELNMADESDVIQIVAHMLEEAGFRY